LGKSFTAEFNLTGKALRRLAKYTSNMALFLAAMLRKQQVEQHFNDHCIQIVWYDEPPLRPEDS